MADQSTDNTITAIYERAYDFTDPLKTGTVANAMTTVTAAWAIIARHFYPDDQTFRRMVQVTCQMLIVSPREPPPRPPHRSTLTRGNCIEENYFALRAQETTLTPAAVRARTAFLAFPLISECLDHEDCHGQGCEQDPKTCPRARTSAHILADMTEHLILYPMHDNAVRRDGPTALIDDRKAEPEVNFPGDLISSHGTRERAVNARAQFILDVLTGKKVWWPK